jgi:hypothetical protein
LPQLSRMAWLPLLHAPNDALGVQQLMLQADMFWT